MVDEVIDERRPRTQENGRDMAIAPVLILPTWTQYITTYYITVTKDI